MTLMTEYVDDELPLPPFADMFWEGLVSSKKKATKLRESAQAQGNYRADISFLS